MTNVVYKGQKENRPSYWIVGELIPCEVIPEVEGIWLRLKAGEKFPEWKGKMVCIFYDRWEDVMDEWFLPKAIEDVMGHEYKGNTLFEHLVQPEITFNGIRLRGWQDGRIQ